MPRVTGDADRRRGRVRVDRFGNLITNIDRTTFERVRERRRRLRSGAGTRDCRASWRPTPKRRRGELCALFGSTDRPRDRGQRRRAPRRSSAPARGHAAVSRAPVASTCDTIRGLRKSCAARGWPVSTTDPERPPHIRMESDLSLEFLRVVEQAAIACAHTMGQGDRHGSDQVAVEAMRREMDTVPIDGTIVIGEGERDEAPMLYIGEKVGLARQGQRRTAGVRRGRHRRRSARGHEPVRDRRAQRDRRAGRVGRRAACCTRPTSTWRSWSSGPSSKHVVDLDAPVRDNLRAIARSLGRQVEDLVVIVLDRPRHEKLIDDIRATGARIRLIGDGDLSAGIAAAVVGQRRARGDGHRRRARRRADRGGDALPERRDLRAPGRRQARARGALPRHGHHRLQAHLPVGGPGVAARTSSSRPPASPTAR